MGLRFNVSKYVTLVIGKTTGSVEKNLVLFDYTISWLKEMCYLSLYLKAGIKIKN